MLSIKLRARRRLRLIVVRSSYVVKTNKDAMCDVVFVADMMLIVTLELLVMTVSHDANCDTGVTSDDDVSERVQRH